MLDQASYTSRNHTAFVNLQFLVGPRAEVVATTLLNTGKAAIGHFTYDASNILPYQHAGLDFGMMSSTFSGFSDLDYRSVTQSLGVNVRLRPNLVLNTSVSVSDLEDQQPYLYDTTGKRVGGMVGVSWVF